MFALVLPSHGQAPALLWATNLQATVFAVDLQTNVYASVGGSVIKLSRDGLPLQTNAICPLPGIARRDASGNFYFAGIMSGNPQDFGGEVVSGKNLFIAKYTSGGALLWARGFGPVHSTMRIRDFQTTSSGVAYATYNYYILHTQTELGLVRFTAAGSNTWDVALPNQCCNASGTAIVGGVTETNGYVYVHPSSSHAYLHRFDDSGVLTEIGTWINDWNPVFQDEARPIGNAVGEVYIVQEGVLIKRNSSGVIAWQKNLGDWWTVAPDLRNGTYVTTWDGSLARYDFDGELAWTLPLPSRCVALVEDSWGNRFVSLTNGTSARLAAEALWPPVITNPPQSQTVLVGSNVTLAVEASGTMLRYFWRFQGMPLPGATNAELIFTNATTDRTGLYTVIVSNLLDSVTSAPVQLRVKSVQLYVGNQMLTNGTYAFATNPTVSIRSVFSSGSAFYTLDGSAPDFSSTHYTSPIPITRSTRIRAIGYSASFLESDEADTVDVIILPRYRLSATTGGGGSVLLNPPGGAYVTNETVVVTATPSPGWTLLYWLGDTNGSENTLSLLMNRNKTIRAVFGTTLSATAAGNGQVLLGPPGGLYPYGATVRLTAVPQPGSYFGVWGNAASGSANPLYFSVTAPTQTISSIFGTTPVGQAVLTVLINGQGHVNISPQANAYPLNQNVTLTAVPDVGQSFVNWTGDASGTQNPLTVSMNAAKMITGQFTSRPRLRLDRAGLEGLTPEGFRFSVTGCPPGTVQILVSSNLSTWEVLTNVTNVFGEFQYSDPDVTQHATRYYKAAHNGYNGCRTSRMGVVRP